MDNKVFNVNGRTKHQLELAVKCLLTTEYDQQTSVCSWSFSKEKGLILYWHTSKDITAFTDKWGKATSLTIEEVVNMLWEWLESDEAKNFVQTGAWDINMQHDGSNTRGWRLYAEDWGKVNQPTGGGISYSICAFIPVYLWYGK